MLLRNSFATERAFPAHFPAVRNTRGRSFGPITTSATRAITSSSDQEKSNIVTTRSLPLLSVEKPAFSAQQGAGIMAEMGSARQSCEGGASHPCCGHDRG